MAKKRLIDAYDLAETIENMRITVAGKPARWDDAKHSVLREISQAPDVDVVDRPKWISVEERLPECETEVFVLAVSSYGNKTVTTAIYEDGTMPEDESAWSWEDVEMDYNEETDQYIIPCGWWEYRHYGESLNFGVDDKVTHWMPLPELPKEGDDNG